MIPDNAKIPAQTKLAALKKTARVEGLLYLIVVLASCLRPFADHRAGRCSGNSDG
jgi:hypothetical protein